MTAADEAWHGLRLQARQLENELDLKLESYAKLATSYQVQVTREDSGAPPPDSQGIGRDTRSLYQVASSMAVEIEQLLVELDAINRRMTALVSSGEVSGTAAHTASHHRGRLHDLNGDFRKTKDRIGNAHNQAELFINMRDKDHHEDMDRMDALLRERGSLHNTDQGANSFLQTGNAVKESLTSQMQMLRGGMSGLGSVRGGFGSIDDVVTLIQKKRSRDCYILTFFISFLICFLLYWGWMR